MHRAFVEKMDGRYRAPNQQHNCIVMQNLINKFMTRAAWHNICEHRRGYGAYCDRVAKKWPEMIQRVGGIKRTGRGAFLPRQQTLPLF